MSVIEDVLTSYLDECTRRGVHARVRAVADRRDEIVARNGVVESETTTEDVIVSLMVSDGNRLAVLAGGVDVAVPTMVSEGMAVLRSLSGAELHAPPAIRERREPRTWNGRSVAALESSREQILGASVMRDTRECELRANQIARTVHYADPSTRLTSSSCYAALVLRATRTADDGGVAHVDRVNSGPDVGELLRSFAGPVAEDARLQLFSPVQAGSPALPERVVLDARVAAQLVGLLASSLSAETVAQGQGVYGGRLGERTCSETITITDDPLLAGGPRHLPFDDEGELGAANTLIERGRLRGFIGSSGYVETVKGCLTGSARQPDATSAPRPAASNLFVVPASTPISLHDTPVLRVVQAHGMHLSNPITGDFSTAATGLVYDGGTVRVINGLSMAGNVKDLFDSVAAVGSELSWADECDSSFGAPMLQVSGLTIGR